MCFVVAVDLYKHFRGVKLACEARLAARRASIERKGIEKMDVALRYRALRTGLESLEYRVRDFLDSGGLPAVRTVE